MEREKGPNIDSYFEDKEADAFFSNFEILHKEKRIIERITEGKKELQAYIDYIAQKKCARVICNRDSGHEYNGLVSKS